jgi:hypothetical protein
MEEPIIPINYMAVVIAVVANFILGWVWYGPLFGKAWGKEMKMDMNQKPPSSVMIRGMVMMVIGSFLMAYVFAHNIYVWKQFMSGMTYMPMEHACMSAFFTWLGFFVPQHLGKVAWEGSSWKLFFINAIYSLVSLFVVALILVMMGFNG